MKYILHLCVIWTLHYTTGQFRLPGNVIPMQYDLRLIFDVDPTSNFSYYGVVNILFHAVTATSKVVLNTNGINFLQRDLKIRNVAAGTDIDVESTSEDKENQLYTLVLKGDLEIDPVYSLGLGFYGNLSMHHWNHNRAGVHVIRYVNNVGIEFESSDGISLYDYTVATKFDPLGARTLFPCFDEPQYRAIFNLAIGHHRLFHCIFNLPRLYSTVDQSMDPYFNWDEINKTFKKSQDLFEWDHFQTTSMISTYRLGFVIHKYSTVNRAIDPALTTTTISTRTPISNHSQKFPSKDFQTNFTLDHASKILSYHEAYFNMPCEARQMEHIFHSSYDYVSSSSLGIVNYAELMLRDDLRSMLMSPFFLTQVMSKETALQWFGNAVTWWNEQWLKEGLAIFLSRLSLATLLGDDKIPETAYLLGPFMKLIEDDFRHTYAIKLPMEMTHPARMNDYYMRSLHNKAGYVFGMLHKLLGKEIFQDALHNFIYNASQSATADDLWAEMSQLRIRHDMSLPNNITEKMVVDSWTTQPGYPLITVTRDYENDSFSLSQKLYTFDDEDPSQGWVLPFQVLVQGEEDPSPIQWLVSLNGTSDVATIQRSVHDEAWLLLITDMTVPCRIDYDNNNWDLLAIALTSTPEDRNKIPAASRAQLLADAHELAKNRHVNFDLVFQLYHSLTMEVDPDVLENGLEHLSSIGLKLQRTPQYLLYNEFVKVIILNHVISSKLGTFIKDRTNAIDYKNLKLYLMISEWSCKLNIMNQAEFYINFFADWQLNAEYYYSGYRTQYLYNIAACVAISRGTQAHWDFVLRQIAKKYEAVDLTSIVSGLTCTREPYLLQRTLEMLIEGKFEIAPNVAAIVKTALHNPVGYYVGKDFLYIRSLDIFKGYSAQAITVALITHLLDQFNSLSDLTEFSTWHKEHYNALVSLGVNATVHRLIHTAHYNILKFLENREEIVNHLHIYYINERSIERDKTGMQLKNAPANKSSNIVLLKFYSLISYILCSVMNYMLF